jgi:hypothetical protein
MFLINKADLRCMRLYHSIYALFCLACLQQSADCPAVAEMPFSLAPVPGLRPDQLRPLPNSNELWGSQRVRVAPFYSVLVSIIVKGNGNGYLSINDDRGHCMETRIYDMHGESDCWHAIRDDMFAYEFADDDGDGELELQIWGDVEVHDEAGIISVYEHRERWDRSLSGSRPWYLAENYDEPHSSVREYEAPPPHETHDSLGCDAAGREWTVHTTREVGSWSYTCRMICDGRPARTMEITSRWDPTFDLQSAAGVSFLVVQQEGMHGTGLSSTWTEWYYLDTEEVSLVTSYYSEGYLNGWGQPYNREIGVSAELVEIPSVRLVLTLNLNCSSEGYLDDGDEFAPAPTNGHNGGHMFSATATAIYSWDAAACKFVVLDKERAEAVEDVMTGSSDYLVEHFCPELQKYIQEYRGQCAPWLKGLRSECDVEANRLLVDSLIAMDS